MVQDKITKKIFFFLLLLYLVVGVHRLEKRKEKKRECRVGTASTLVKAEKPQRSAVKVFLRVSITWLCPSRGYWRRRRKRPIDTTSTDLGGSAANRKNAPPIWHKQKITGVLISGACPTKREREESDWYTLMSPNGRCVFHFGERKMKHTAEGALSRIFAGVATLYMADEFKAHAIAPSATTPIKSFFSIYSRLTPKFYGQTFLSL